MAPLWPMSFSPDSPHVSSIAPSPNHDQRQAGVDLLLLHYTGMPDADEAVARLCDPASKVSCHYLVHEDGRIVQMVPEERRAWHAGLSVWEDETDTNSRSVGIEIQNPGHDFGYRDFPDAQIEAVIRLGLDICERHGIARNRVLAHSDVAPRRKTDPSRWFPWRTLAQSGFGVWCDPPYAPAPPEADTMLMLAALGYDVSDPAAARAAFQRRFLPHGSAEEFDEAGRALLHCLLVQAREP